MLAGGSATPLISGIVEATPAADLAITICQRWLAVAAERRRLQIAWSDHETWLARTYGWLRLSASEQAAVPEGAKLAKIDARLDMLEAESQALLKALPLKPATSIASVIANLSVAEGLLSEEDQPEIHGMILRAVRDIAVLCARK